MTERDRDPGASRREAPDGAGPEDRGDGSFLEGHLLPALKERTLWPVWIVIIAHVAAFGAWALLLALEERRISALLGVFGLFWLTGTAAVAEMRHRGGPGAISLVIALIWATTLGFFFAARYWEIV